jgi:hypothetical protein
LNSEHPNNPGILSRREALKGLLAAGSMAGLTVLPERWQSPLIEVGRLPAHAQTSSGVSPFFRVVSVRELTPCENEGKHHIFIKVQDAAGRGINGVPVMVCWGAPPDNCARPVTETHSKGDGWIEFAMFKGTYSVTVAEGTSQVASGLTPDYAVDELCEKSGNEQANSQYHISFEVIFERSE